jgi:hypothetical protein
MPRVLFLAPLLLTGSLVSTASAHFLFVRICPPAEGGRAAEVYFSELAAAGDPRFIAKVGSAKFWIQTKPGDFRPLEMRTLSDRLRAHVPVGGSLMVAGQLDYGVLAREGQTPFLLRHYSKAVAGPSDEVNRLGPKGTNLEVVASFEPGRIVLTSLLGGKPVPRATFSTVDANLSGGELKADADGRATFTPEGPGIYSVYTRHDDLTPGTHSGAPYKEVREFATLSFAWPLVPTGADPEAVKLFEDAIAARAAWKDFGGFTAKIEGSVEDRPFDGRVTVAADGSVKLDLAEDVVQEWVQDQMESITMHRAADQTPSADRPKPVLRFADDHDDHPLGRLLTFEGGHFATSYRVKGRQITSVNRFLDGKNMTITVLHNEKNAEGLFLPQSYTVQYWDEASGKLDRTEATEDRWTRVGNWDLPVRHTVTSSSDQGFSVRSFRLSDHQLTDQNTR